MNKSVLNILNYVVGIITVILLIIFKDNMQLEFISMSICCVFIGVLFNFNELKYGTLVSGIGISGIITFIIFKSKLLNFNDSVTFFMSTTLCFSCIVSILFDAINRKRFMKKYSMAVVGKVVDLEKNNNTKKLYYRPVYEYVIDGDSYTCSFPFYLNKNIPKLGDDMPIYINPDDYTETYFKPELKTVINAIVIALVFAICCIGIDIFLFI